jgi:hypothetical protein
MFEDIVHMGLNGLEKPGGIIGYDLEDMTKELIFFVHFSLLRFSIFLSI